MRIQRKLGVSRLLFLHMTSLPFNQNVKSTLRLLSKHIPKYCANGIYPHGLVTQINFYRELVVIWSETNNIKTTAFGSFKTSSSKFVQYNKTRSYFRKTVLVFPQLLSFFPILCCPHPDRTCNFLQPVLPHIWLASSLPFVTVQYPLGYLFGPSSFLQSLQMPRPARLQIYLVCTISLSPVFFLSSTFLPPKGLKSFPQIPSLGRLLPCFFVIHQVWLR